MKQSIVSILLLIAMLLSACLDKKDEAPPPEQSANTEVSGDAERGAELFKAGKGDDSPPCSACHKVSASASGFALGPLLEDIATRGATRVEGLSAEDYIQDSILHPDKYLVPGFRVSMYPDYIDHLSPQDIADLIAYLMTL